MPKYVILGALLLAASSEVEIGTLVAIVSSQHRGQGAMLVK